MMSDPRRALWEHAFNAKGRVGNLTWGSCSEEFSRPSRVEAVYGARNRSVER